MKRASYSPVVLVPKTCQGTTARRDSSWYALWSTAHVVPHALLLVCEGLEEGEGLLVGQFVVPQVRRGREHGKGAFEVGAWASDRGEGHPEEAAGGEAPVVDDPGRVREDLFSLRHGLIRQDGRLY